MKIPKIIHQTWKTAKLPLDKDNRYEQWVNSWKQKNPTYEYRLWTDTDNRRLIQREFPAFLHFYDALPMKINRVDIIRYFILIKYGGVYADLDFECYKPLDELLADHSLIIASEPIKHCRDIYKRERLICNAWMASIPNHPYWWAVIHEALQRIDKTYSVLDLAGPFLTENVYEHVIATRKYDIYECDRNLLYPFDKSSEKNAYAKHHWKNTWTHLGYNTIRFPNFTFYSTMDSIGNDVERASSIQGAFEKAQHNNSLIAFNTDNNVKTSAMNLQECWSNDRGIYIKDYTVELPELEGYEFVIGLDSQDGDICRFKTKDLKLMKEIADRNPWCIAFNTDGWFKYELNTFKKVSVDVNGRFGMYIKKNIDIPQLVSGYKFCPYVDCVGEDICSEGPLTRIPVFRSESDLFLTNPLEYMDLDRVILILEKYRDQTDAVAVNLDGNIKRKVGILVKQPVYRFQGIFIKDSK